MVPRKISYRYGSHSLKKMRYKTNLTRVVARTDKIDRNCWLTFWILFPYFQKKGLSPKNLKFFSIFLGRFEKFQFMAMFSSSLSRLDHPQDINKIWSWILRFIIFLNRVNVQCSMSFKMHSNCIGISWNEYETCITPQGNILANWSLISDSIESLNI